MALRTSSFLLVLVLAGCGDPTGGSVLPDAAPVLHCDGLFEGEPARALQIGAMHEDVFVPWSDGREVPFVWGPQGGTMIVPSLRIDAAIDPSATPCVSVELTNHEPDGGARFADFRTVRFAVTAEREDGFLMVRDLFDQLGIVEIPRGSPLDLEVVVRGRTGAADGRASITVVPTGGHPECEALPARGEGCRYREIPSTARIVRVSAAGPEDARCPLARDALVIEAEVTVDERYEACAITPRRTELVRVASYLPSSACAEQLGLVEGAELEVEHLAIFAGTCTPEMLSFPALSQCAAACIGER